jgi:hypothetical protein
VTRATAACTCSPRMLARDGDMGRMAGARGWMREAGMGKMLSCSMIEVNGVVLMISVEVPSTCSKKCQARVRS